MGDDPGRGPGASDRGAGLVGTLAGSLVALLLLLFATQVLVGRHAESMTVGVVDDAVRRVAADPRVADGGASGLAEAARQAEADARGLLGGQAGRTWLSWRIEGDDVVAEVRFELPTFLAAPWGEPAGERTRVLRARIERLR